jgi:hypothetical protein
MTIKNDHFTNVLQKLNTPEKIQDYLESIPFNHEKNGETCYSARLVVKNKTAHCLEGSFLACAALEFHNKKATIVSLRVTNDDYDHVITIFKENNHYGAISKTNHAVLGYRDPVYRSVRELIMTYFHEYFLVKNGKKTLLAYSRPINLNKFGTSWKDSIDDQFFIAEAISEKYHIPIISSRDLSHTRRATALERKTASISWDDI